MDETITLHDLVGTLRKHLKLLLCIAFVSALASAIISYFVLTPIYQSTTQLLINQTKTDQQPYNPMEVQANLQLINTYNVIIKSPVILEKVADNLNLKLTVKKLSNKITVQNEKDSQVVNVSVEDPDPKQAAAIANEIAAVFQEDIVNIMNVDNVSILAKAEATKGISPVKPQPLLNILIAFIIGLMAGIGVAFLREYLDNTIKTEQDVERLLGLSVLGSVAPITVQEAMLETNKIAAGGERSEA
ncbi:hypothetical protein AC623_02375 [Bacillus sp. FJAT-27231]|uniref:YveK family protein n=1 Tax=Bacillus sp. FJAT-27231 TaxID=1679168 RepID=UPI000670E1CA|nr:Wzz/FepE/Etk N-terminal domain-containing protein [Bacillus sp. FJAT-27231]KMY52976.1 hypothetical protein AC623_02375 [Bacillus sp. FJAT-27231]